MRLCLENTQHRIRAGGVVQVLEHLPSKYEALSSNTNAIKNKTESKKPYKPEFPVFCQNYYLCFVQ
jgi:hypothetical protein